MKKKMILAALFTAVLMLIAGCGGFSDDPAGNGRDSRKQKDEDNVIVGQDWRTWQSYQILDWHGADVTSDI